MFIIRYPYSHQYKRVIVIVYWSEYPDRVIQLSNQTVESAQTLIKFQNTECLTAYAHLNRKMNGSHDLLSYIGTRAIPESAIMDLQCILTLHIYFLKYTITKTLMSQHKVI